MRLQVYNCRGSRRLSRQHQSLSSSPLKKTESLFAAGPTALRAYTICHNNPLP